MIRMKGPAPCPASKKEPIVNLEGLGKLPGAADSNRPLPVLHGGGWGTAIPLTLDS